MCQQLEQQQQQQQQDGGGSNSSSSHNSHKRSSCVLSLLEEKSFGKTQHRYTYKFKETKYFFAKNDEFILNC